MLRLRSGIYHTDPLRLLPDLPIQRVAQAKGGSQMRRIFTALVSLAALVLGSGAGTNGY